MIRYKFCVSLFTQKKIVLLLGVEISAGKWDSCPSSKER